MLVQAVRNDMSRTKTTTATTTLFVTAAALLVALAFLLMVNLTGAIDALMEGAKTPHFLQMHAGPINRTRLESFVDDRPEIVDHQVLEFLNVDGARIRFGERSLAASVQDNGFSVQSPRFDFLLDVDGNVLHVAPGEVYVPISYWQSGLARIGETMQVGDTELTVAGPFRDSLMNSLLSSSKRFLVHEADFMNIRQLGNVEYLIEFRVADPAYLGVLENAYVTAGLESNGPTIVAPLFRTLNALSDGLTIALILLLSVLVLAVALLCVRFTLLAKIEEDYREIGVMKAIGLRISDVKKVYLLKYAIITGSGSAVGLALAFAFQGLLLENIRLYMGDGGRPMTAALLAVLVVVIMGIVILAFVNRVLRRFERISPAEAIRFGVSQENPAAVGRFKLRTSTHIPANILLGLRDVLSRAKTSTTMLAVLIVAVFLVVVPRNLANTIASDGFITYMGLGRHDLRLDIQQTTDVSDKARRIADAMAADDEISRFVVLTTKNFTVRGDNGANERLKVELGDHSVFPISYAEGGSPRRENEIALSVLNAEALGREVGDTITVIIDGRPRELTVCGVYSDVTNGGRTAKAVFDEPSAEVMWSVVAADLVDSVPVDQKVQEYSQRFEFAKVSDVEEFVRQTFGTTIDSIQRVSSIAFVVALVISSLVALLFVRMLVAGDRYPIAVLKSTGFTTADIRSQYIVGSFLITLLGVLLGTLLANTAGEALARSVIGWFGASSFDFTVDVRFSYFIGPLSMLAITLASTHASTRTVAEVTIYENIKE
jgi:putative ABC transport system permease protein